jgi:hypothetical protein
LQQSFEQGERKVTVKRMKEEKDLKSESMSMGDACFANKEGSHVANDGQALDDCSVKNRKHDGVHHVYHFKFNH